MGYLLYWLIVGGVAGWLGGEIMRGDGFGLIGNIIVGIIGSFIGGFVFDALGLAAEGNIIMSIVSALVGAIVLLFVASLIKR